MYSPLKWSSFFTSKKAPADVDVLEAEQLDDLGQRPDLDAVGRRPSPSVAR